MRTGPDAKLRPALFVSYPNGVSEHQVIGERMMRKMLAMLTAVLVLCLAAGCGNDKEKGQNRDKDKPRAGEMAK